MAAVLGLMPGSRPRGAGPARSRPSRRARPGAARPTGAGSARGRPSGRPGRSRPGGRRDVDDLDVHAGPRDDVARPVGARGEQAVDEVVDPGRAHRLPAGRRSPRRHRPCRSGCPTRHRPPGAARRPPARARPRRGSGSGSRARAPRTARPCGRCRGRPRTVRRRRPRPAARPRPWTLRTGCPATAARSARAGARRRGCRRRPRWSRHDQQLGPARGAGLGQDAGRRRVAPHRELRVERAAVDVGPGGGMDDDLGPVAVEQRRRSRSGASRSNAARVQAIGPAGPVNGASARAATRSRPRRPAGAGDGDPHQSPRRGRGARRRRSWPRRPGRSPAGGRTGARTSRPSRPTGPRATTPRWPGTSRRSRPGRPRTRSPGASRARPASTPSIA